MEISIVIPTYNRGNEVVRALQSALAQTYPDREIIIIDDGSNDDTVERLRPYQDQIRYVYQDNQGASAAQNAGIKIARGEYVAVLASDDLWEPTKLERQVRLLQDLGNEFGVCFTDCRYFGNPKLQATAFQEAGLDFSGKACVVADPKRHVLAKNPAFFVQSLLVRRALLLKVNCLDENLEIGEDTDLIFRLSFHTRFCVIGEPLVQIDRSTSLSRLMDLYQIPDIAYRNIQLRLEQWLAMPELVEKEIHGQIRGQLIEMFYNWAIAKLYRWEFAEALQKLRLIRTNDNSWIRIASHLTCRVSHRLLARKPDQLLPKARPMAAPSPSESGPG